MKYSHSESPVGTSTQIRRAARPSSTMDVKVPFPLHLPPSNLPSSPGNRNNFASQKACQNYCLSESCPPGTVVAKEAEAGRLVSCSNPGRRESVGREESALSISHTLSPLSLSLSQGELVECLEGVQRATPATLLLFSIRTSAVEPALSCSVRFPLSPFAEITDLNFLIESVSW